MYKFDGRIIKLTSEDYDRWRKAYSAIPADCFTAELQALDDFYHEEKIEKWFIRASAALRNRNRKYLQEKRDSAPVQLVQLTKEEALDFAVWQMEEHPWTTPTYPPPRAIAEAQYRAWRGKLRVVE